MAMLNVLVDAAVSSLLRLVENFVCGSKCFNVATLLTLCLADTGHCLVRNNPNLRCCGFEMGATRWDEITTELISVAPRCRARKFTKSVSDKPAMKRTAFIADEFASRTIHLQGQPAHAPRTVSGQAT